LNEQVGGGHLEGGPQDVDGREVEVDRCIREEGGYGGTLGDSLQAEGSKNPHAPTASEGSVVGGT
jgi:hypothetical protein